MTCNQSSHFIRYFRQVIIIITCFVFVSSGAGHAQDTTPEALFRRGALQFEQGRYVSARLDFSNIVEFHADSPWAPAAVMMLAKSYYAMGDIDEARTMAARLISNYPWSRYADWAPYLIAACEYSAGNINIALDRLAVLAADAEDEALRMHALAAVRDVIQPVAGSQTVADALQSAGVSSDALEGLPSAEAIENTTSPAFPISPSTLHTGDSFKVGLLTPLTGMNADLGTQLLAGVEAILVNHEEINGREIELIVEDTASDPVTAILKTRDLIGEGVIAIIGPVLSEESFGPAALAAEHGIPFLAPTTTDPEFTRLGRFVYQLNLNPEIQARALADLAGGVLECGTYAVIATDDPWGKTVAETFSDRMTSYGSTTIHIGYYNADSPTDNDELFMQIRDRAPDSGSVIDSVVVLDPGSAFPDTLFVRQSETYRGEQMLGPINSIDCIMISATSEQAALIASQLMANHIETIILGDNGWWSNDQAIRLGMTYVEGAFVVAPVGELSGGGGAALFGGRLTGDFATRVPVMRGADAARLLVHCFENGAVDPSSLAGILDNISNFKGVASYITIDPERRMNTAVDFIHIRNGQYDHVDLSQADRLRDEVRVRFFPTDMDQFEQDVVQ